MSSEGGGKVRPKRSHAAPPKPYERNQSLLSKVAEAVRDILSPSWLTDLVSSVRKSQAQVDKEEAENKRETKDSHETGLLSADSTGPSTSVRGYEYDRSHLRSNGQPRNQDFPSQTVSPSLPTTFMSPLSEFTSLQLPLARLVQKSDSMIVNDDNQSQRSDISKSTSGCSSMIPHPDKKDYQSEVLLEEHSYSDVSITASASVITSSSSYHPLQQQQQQHLTDKYQRVPVVEKTYAWTPHSSGIQQSKPQVPANRNQPSFNVSLFGSPVADTSYLEQRFESSFYSGKTTYGGASAYRQARLNNSSPYQSYPVRKQMKPKATNNTFTAVTSSTARRILEALEKMSSPVHDNKRLPVDEYLQQSFLAQSPSSNRSLYGQLSARTTPGSSGFNSSFTSRSEVKKGPPLKKLIVPEFAVISKNRQKLTPPDVMARLDARIREENEARTVEGNSWSISHQDTVAVKDLPTGSSSGKIKRDKSYHKPAKKSEQDDMLNIPELKTDFTLPMKELPKFQFTPTISGTKILDSNLQKEKLSPKFTFSSPVKEAQPVEEKHPASSVRSQEFKFSSPIKVDEEKNSAPSFSFVTITSSSSTSFSTSVCSFGMAVSKTSIASSTEHELIMKSTLSDTAPRVKESPKVKAAADVKQGNVDESLKGGKSPFHPAAQLKAGSVMDILGKTDSSSPMLSSNNLFAKFQPAAGSWKCGVCLIQNKAEDIKCPACQTPKPTASSKPTPTQGSNLCSTSTSVGSWKCDTCLIQNKAEVNKCAACGAVRPVKATGSGFGFTTTPLVNLTPAGCWKCDTCLIQNKADVNSCAACCSAKPVKLTGSESNAHFPESYLNPFPPGNWICASCLIQNKADAVKCGKCQSDKPTGKSSGITKTDNSLLDKFKPAVGSWTCNICLVLNNGSSTKCISCETEKPAPKTGNAFMNSFKKPSGTWDCEICLVTNKPTAIQCIACDSPRPGEKPKQLVPSVAGFKIAAGAFAQNSGFNLPSVAQNHSSAPPVFKFGSTPVKSDNTTTPGFVGFKFGDNFQSGTSSEMKTQNTFKLGDSNTDTKSNSASVVDSQAKNDLGKSDLKVGGETTTINVETISTVGRTTDNVFGQKKDVGSNSDLLKGNLTTEEFNLKPSGISNIAGNSTIKTGGFEFKFHPSSSNQSNTTSFPSSTSIGGSSFSKPTIDSLDSSGQTLSESQGKNGGITTTSQFSTPSNVSSSVTVSKLESQQSSGPSSKAEPGPSDGFRNSTQPQTNSASDTNKPAVGGFNFISKSSEESKVENKPFVFGATANTGTLKSIFSLKPKSETSKLKRTNSSEDSDASPGGKRQAMGLVDGSLVNNATGGTTVAAFNLTGFESGSPAAAAPPTAAPVFNFTGQNSAPNSSVFTFTGQDNTRPSPFPAFGLGMSTVSNTPAFGGTSQFSVKKEESSTDMITSPSGSTTTLAFGAGMGSSNIQFGGNGFGSTTATAPGFGGSAGIPFGAPAPVFGGNTTPSATTTAGFSFVAPQFSSTTQNYTFQFNSKPTDSKPQQQSANPASSVFVFGQTPANTKPQQQAANPASSVFVFGQTPANTKPQQQSANPASSVFVFGQTPANTKPQQQSANPASSVFVFGQTPANTKPQQQPVNPPNSVFVFGQTPANTKPQQQPVNTPNSVFVFGQTPANTTPQQQPVNPPNTVFVFGQSQPNTSTQVAPAPQGQFNFNSTPVFNFTGSSTPGPYAFSATSSQGENSSSNRRIKKAVRKLRR